MNTHSLSRSCFSILSCLQPLCSTHRYVIKSKYPKAASQTLPPQAPPISPAASPGDHTCTWYVSPWPAHHPFLFSREKVEKAMTPHSGTLAWKIPWMEEPSRLWSMGSLGVGHDWAISLSLSTFMHWRRKWQPTPVFLPGESQGRGSLVGCLLWGRTESDTTEAT